MNKPLDTNCEILPPATPLHERFKDELNFAEFPLGTLSDNVASEQKTLVFVDTIFDEGRNHPVTRKLTISASDEYGLPRALDEEVILGLIQLTNRQCFRDRKVYFSSYELIKLLGWNDGAKSYKRIEDALKRWLGVTLYYDRAWWSKEEKCWVSENFHVLDSVTIYDRERRDGKKNSKPQDPTAGRSYFVWNEIVFQSFQAGNLKEIDLDVYRQLKSAIAKRLYRFLDKRFYQRSNLEFDLCTLAFEHIGLSRSSSVGEVKRLLAKPLEELESIGFIKSLTKEERYKKLGKGAWRVFFQKGAAEARSLLSEDQAQLVELLKQRKVSPAKASKLARSFPKEAILQQIAVHDWLLSNKDRRCSENPAGFLVASIQGEFPVPAGFLKSREEAKSQLRVVKEVTPRKDESDTVRDGFHAWWQALSPEERDSFEHRALERSDPFTKRHYLEGKAVQGSLFKAAREKMLMDLYRDERE